MKTYLLLSLALMMFLPAMAICQEHEEEEYEVERFHEQQEEMSEIEHMEQQISIRRMQLELEREEAEFRFQQEMRELELNERRAELQRHEKHKPGQKHDLGLLMAGCLIVHILVAVWVYQDIRKRQAGSGLWIAIALLAGLIGALVYAVVRLGDEKIEK